MAIASAANSTSRASLNLVLLFALSTCLYGQQSANSSQRYSFDFSQTPLLEALSRIEEAAAVDLVYANALLEDVWIDRVFENETLDTVFTWLLAEAGFRFRWATSDRVLLTPLADIELRTLSGTVISPSGILPQARVRVTQTARVGMTDPAGRFRLPRLPTTKLKLRISAPGFVDATLELEGQKGSHQIEVVLYPKPILAEQITVSNAPPLTRDGPLAIQGDWLRPTDLVSRGSVSRDLFHGLAAVPGLATGLGEGGVSIRGARPAENLILLEGIKLYEVEHALGHFSAINPDAVGVITLYKSAFPAKYGDRMAGVLDIGIKGEPWETREVRAGFDRDLAHATMTTPVGSKATLLLSARQSHSDATSNSVSDRLFAATFNEENDAIDDEEFQSQRQFRFEDQLLRFNLALGQDTNLSFTGFRSRDSTDEKRTEQVADLSESVFDRRGEWGNTGSSLRWNHHWNQRQQSQFLASWSEYRSDFGIFEETEFDEFARGFREEQIDRKTRLAETRLQWEHHFRFTPNHQLTMGLFSSKIRLRLSEAYENIEFGEVEFEGDFEIVDEDGFFYEEVFKTRQTGGFLNYAGKLGEDWQWLLGTRIGENSATNTDFFEPRLSLHWYPHKHLEVSGSWGQVHQFVLRSPDTINYFRGEPTWFLAEEDEILPGEAEGYQLGSKYQVGTLTLALDAYRKEQRGSLLRRFNPLRPGEDVVQTGETYEGFDFGFVKHLVSWSFNVGYGYQKTRIVENISEADAVNFPTARDRPHSLQTAVSWYGRAWEASCQWRYASGLPFDVPTIEEEGPADDPELSLLEPEERYGFRLSSRNQIDLRTSYGFRFFRSEMKLGFSVTNVLDRDNVTHRFFILDEEDEDLLPVDILDFGRRFSFDFQVRF